MNTNTTKIDNAIARTQSPTLPANFEELADLIASASANASELRANVRRLARIMADSGNSAAAESFELGALYKHDPAVRQAVSNAVYALVR